MNIHVDDVDGNNVVDIKLRRDVHGIRVRTRVAPEVEEFFQRWGGGGKDDSRHTGRLWKPYRGASNISLWTMPPGVTSTSDSNYSLHAAGYPLQLDNGSINLTMIRLVGAGTPAGAEFICDMVVSTPELENIAARIRRASEAFYAEYIMPVGMHIYVSSKVRKFDTDVER